MWNCRKGLINKENSPTTKIVDVKDFLSANDLQILCLIEADLHGITSRVKRIKPITSREIEENLKVENYKTLLPQSWQAHGQARILLYKIKKKMIMYLLVQTNRSFSLTIYLYHGNVSYIIIQGQYCNTYYSQLTTDHSDDSIHPI